MRFTILVRSTIHTRAVLLSIDQYMDMHQHFITLPLNKSCNELWISKNDVMIPSIKNKIKYICQPQRFKQTLRFTHTYIHVLKASLTILSISDDAKLNLDVWNRIQNKTNLDFRNRNLNHTETDKRTQNTNDDVDDVRSSWSSVEVVEDDACSDASFRCHRVDAPSIRNV